MQKDVVVVALITDDSVSIRTPAHGTGWRFNRFELEVADNACDAEASHFYAKTFPDSAVSAVHYALKEKGEWHPSDISLPTSTRPSGSIETISILRSTCTIRASSQRFFART